MNYTIKPGDTLSELALKFNTSVDALMKANNIKNKNVIYIGDNLIVPNDFNANPLQFDLWAAIKRFLGIA